MGCFIMIDIISAHGIITIDIIEFITDKKWIGSGDNIKCNVYFEKFECKFMSKDVVISYDELQQFHLDLKQFLHNKKSCCFSDKKGVISLKLGIYKDKTSSLVECNDCSLEFKLFYYEGSNINFTGHSSVYKNSLRQTIEQIEIFL